MSKCMLCPRECGVDRERGQLGTCHAPAEVYVARIAPHHFEEPPISGTRGSGTVFFAGCSLGCIFCQNQEISRGVAGKPMSEEALADAILALADTGVHNINLVTGTHYTDAIARVLRTVKPHLRIPVVWNSSGYEREETLRLLEGLVDIYLPDFKYMSPELASLCSNVPDYVDFATLALQEMVRQTGPVVFDEAGMLLKGTVVRHLVLPGCRRDSLEVLQRIAESVPVADIRLSLMRQYTPDFAPRSAPKWLQRRVTSFEYDAVAAEALRLGFEGFLQEKSSATVAYTPDFTEDQTS
ncbi:MAG: radical SAM protein [Ruminococcaceae bacterium]|nr:radical SAM protein [Oscillospiraceae bacterium]